MEEEIDLRPYVQALLRRWRLIALLMLVGVVVAVLIALLSAPAYTARADILMLSARSELAFDQRFVTGDAAQSLDSNARRQALTALASQSTLEEQVLAQLPEGFVAQDYQAGNLAQRIEVRQEGDLLQIVARADDPQHALTLANAWGQVYVQLVNDIYGDNQGLLQEVELQLNEARQRYDQAQQELETFIGNSQLVQLDQQISVMEGLLNGSREANQALYTQYLSRTQELELILNDARTLRQQVASGQTDGFAGSLASLALQARTIGNVQLPVDLRFDGPDSLAQSDTVSLADLDTLIAILQERRAELLDLSQQFAQATATGQDNATGLPATLRRQYEQELTRLKQQYEQEIAQQRALEQQRNLALDSLAILQRKLDEQRIAQGTSSRQVRLVGVVNDPPESILSQIVINSVIALMLSLLLGIVVVLWLEVIGPRISATQPAPSPTQGDRPADRPVTS